METTDIRRSFFRVELDAASQPLADLVIEAVHGGRDAIEVPAFPTLAAILNEDGGGGVLNEVICDESNWLHSPTLDDLVHATAALFEGPHTDEGIVEALRVSAKRAIDGDPGFWGDEAKLPVVGTIHHSNDERTALLVFMVEMLDGPFDFVGAYADWRLLQQTYRGLGHIWSVAELDTIPMTKLLSVWGRTY